MSQICLIIGIIFLLMEMFIPAYFFLNLAIAAIICAVIPLIFNISLTALVVIYCVLSMVLILVLRPILTKHKANSALDTGMNAKYIGKCAKVIEDIDKNKGAITIYDERWQARSNTDEAILKDEVVEIISYDGLIMIVKKTK